MTGPGHLAVYGTLRPGASNAHVLADVEGSWRSGTISATWFADGWHGFPGVVLGSGARVAVDVLTSASLHLHLDRLDAFEGPGYRRVVTPVALDHGPTVEAWVYELVTSPA